MLNEFGNAAMPHQIIEYSANLQDVLDIDGLVEHLHSVAAGLEPLPLAGLRTRAYSSQQYRVADSHPDNAFLAIYLRIGKGRDEATRVEVGKALFDALCEFTAAHRAEHPIALSYEVQEIDPVTRWNENNLREHLAARAAAAQNEGSTP